MTQPSWKPSMTIMDLIRQLGQQPQYSPELEVEPQYQTPNMQPWQIEMALRRQGKDLGEGLYGRIPQGTTASSHMPLAQTGPPGQDYDPIAQRELTQMSDADRAGEGLFQGQYVGPELPKRFGPYPESALPSLQVRAQAFRDAGLLTDIVNIGGQFYFEAWRPGQEPSLGGAGSAAPRGMIRAEDGSLVPPSFYGMGAGQGAGPMPQNVPAGPYQRPMQPQQGPSFMPPRGLAGAQNVQLPAPSRGEDYYNQGRIDFSKQPPPGTTNLYDLVRWGQDPNVRFQNFTPPGLPGSQIPSRGMVEPMGRMPQEPTANGTVPRTRVSAQPAGRPSSMILSDALKKAIAEAQARRQQGKNQKQKARQAINPYRAK